MLASGAAGHGRPRPGPALLEASCAWGHSSDPWGPHSPTGLSWASCALRSKAPLADPLAWAPWRGVGRCPRLPSLAVAVPVRPGPHGPGLCLGLLCPCPQHPAPSRAHGRYSWGPLPRGAPTNCSAVVRIQGSTASHCSPCRPHLWDPGWDTSAPALVPKGACVASPWGLEGPRKAAECQRNRSGRGLSLTG